MMKGLPFMGVEKSNTFPKGHRKDYTHIAESTNLQLLKELWVLIRLVRNVTYKGTQQVHLIRSAGIFRKSMLDKYNPEVSAHHKIGIACNNHIFLNNNKYQGPTLNGVAALTCNQSTWGHDVIMKTLQCDKRESLNQNNNSNKNNCPMFETRWRQWAHKKSHENDV